MSNASGHTTAVKPDPGAPSGPATQTGAAVEDPATDAQVELTIKSQDNTSMKFRVKRHTPFQKVFHAWAGRKGVNENTYRFVHDGSRLTPQMTPEQANVENGDTIDAMMTQEGGSLCDRS